MYIPKQLILKSTYVISNVTKMQDKGIFVNDLDENIYKELDIGEKVGYIARQCE